MPESYVIRTAAGLVESWAWGSVTDAQVIQHYARMARDPQFSTQYSQVIDCRNASLEGVTEAALSVVAHMAVFSPNTRRAIIVGNDAQRSVAARFAQYAHAADQNVRVFFDEAEARHWLDQSAPRTSDR